MARPPISSKIVEAIEIIWSELSLKRGRPPTALAAHAALHQNQRFSGLPRTVNNQIVSLRKVQSIVGDIRRRGGRFEPTPWRPWRDPTETTEDSDLLLTLNSDVLKHWGRGLFEHEAVWARRLRGPLTGMKYSRMSGQTMGEIWLTLLALYAHREAVGRMLETEAYTTDLDGFLSFAPWGSHGWDGYKAAIESGLIEVPRVVVHLSHEDGATSVLEGTDALLLNFIGAGNPASIDGLSVPDDINSVTIRDHFEDVQDGVGVMNAAWEKRVVGILFEGGTDEWLDQTAEQEQLGADDRPGEGQQGATSEEVRSRQG